MVQKIVINTERAPATIGTYSQAIRVDNCVYLSGQIALDPETMLLISEDFRDQINQVFKNLSAVAEAADGSLSDIVKLNVYLTNLENFSIVNDVMSDFFTESYPARAAIGVLQLPKNAQVEVDAILHVDN